MSEQQLQKKCIKYLEGEGFYVVKVVSGSKAGIPDLIVCAWGRFIAFEMKLEYNSLTPLQEYNFRKIDDAGGDAYEINSLEQLKRIIGRIKEIYIGG